jgi:hypothetical protein
MQWANQYTRLYRLVTSWESGKGVEAEKGRPDYVSVLNHIRPFFVGSEGYYDINILIRMRLVLMDSGFIKQEKLMGFKV